MGLFSRPTVAQPQQDHAFTNVIQNEGGNTGRGLIAWRDPRTDFNTHSKLIVRRGEEAVFENGGSEYISFTNGEYDLATDNHYFFRNLREKLSGGASRFPCRVYFVSVEEFQIGWGTTSPIGYTCPILGPGIHLYGGGEYTLRVHDSETFTTKLLRDSESYTIEDLKDKLFERTKKNILDIISETLEKNQINCMEVSKKAREIADAAMPRISDLLSPYGISLIDFTAELEVDEEQRQMYEQEFRKRSIRGQGAAAEVNALGGNYAMVKGLEALQASAENPNGGGMANMGMGMGMGMAAAQMFSQMGGMFGGQQAPQQAPQQQAPQQQAPQQPAAADPMETLAKLKKMLDAGLIPQAAYDAKVQEVLAKM
ncbi:MAG: SPFH domain-containing protein [Bacteroidaceae bacterium]|nr:SPFH domain-containing protein [Bacteroidaceae bacterium]